MANVFDFTRREMKDILISLLVLSIVFAYPEVMYQPLFAVTSLLTVGVAFVGHELSHRFVARRMGFHSEYVMWKQGLIMALLFAFISNGTFIFAAPGAVVFASYWASRGPSAEQIGKIGIAGTVFNTVLVYLSLALYLLTGSPLFSYMGIINGWLAIFNLIPFGPLDGRKVMKWNLRIWLLVLLLAVAGFGILSIV